MSTLQRAIEIATQAHKGQFDKTGKDYIEYPLRVMEMGAELSRLWSEGTSVADIANHFGRKNSAIITRIKKLGL
jgi:(p)ppGpp synthase/HD superfamily hydrolase